MSFIFTFTSTLLAGILVAYYYQLKKISNSSYLNDNIVPANTYPEITFCISYRNEADKLPLLYASMQLQDYPANRVHLFLYDDASEDRGTSWLKQHIEPDKWASVNFLTLPDKAIGKSFKKSALNDAVQRSESPYVVCTDADCVLFPTFISDLVTLLHERKAGMVSGPVVTGRQGGFMAYLQYLESLALNTITSGTMNKGHAFTCNGAHMAFSREAFLGADPYKDNWQTAGGDDVFLLNALQKKSCKIIYNNISAAPVYTDAAPGLNSYLQQRLRWLRKMDNQLMSSASVLGKTTLLAHLSPLIAGIIFWVHPSQDYLILFLCVWMMKAVSDFQVMQKTAHKFNLPLRPVKVLLFEWPQAFLTLILLLMFIFRKSFIWKGRTYRK